MNHKDLTIYQIRLASTDEEIEAAIEARLAKFRGKNLNGHLVKNYIATMTTLLLNLKGEAIGQTAKDNIARAIEIYRKVNRSKAW